MLTREEDGVGVQLGIKCVCVRLSVVCSIAYADLLMSRHCNGLDVCCRMFVWPM